MLSSTTGLTLAPDASIDLHMHTTFSDGRWPAQQLINYLVSEQFDLRIDLARRRVMSHNQPIELKQMLLFDLLAYLVLHRGVVLTRDHLLHHVWGYEHGVNTRTVDVHVRWLRQILEDYSDSSQLIETVRGVGYRFNG